MIIDNVKNCEKYFGTDPLFERAFEAISAAVVGNQAPGVYEFDGMTVYYKVQEYAAKSANEGKYENHRKYIDIQFVAEGEELVFIGKAEDCTVVEPYNPDNDMEYVSRPAIETVAVLRAGDFAILWPDEIHRPCITVNGENSPVRNILVKIAVDRL